MITHKPEPPFNFTPAPAIAFFRSTNDEMLGHFADTLEQTNELPSESELIELLVFFLVFSMGCNERKKSELAQTFSTRAENFKIGLVKMGLKPGKFRNYVLARQVDGMYDTVVNTAMNRATYRMVDLERTLRIPKPLVQPKNPRKKK